MSSLSAFHIIAERRIEKAIKEGKLNTFSFKGKPLPDDNTGHVPDDLKMAYKILKNSDYLPPEIEKRKEISRLEELIAKTEDEHVRIKQIRKLNFLTMKLDSLRNRPSPLNSHQDYTRKVTEKITLNDKDELA